MQQKNAFKALKQTFINLKKIKLQEKLPIF